MSEQTMEDRVIWRTELRELFGNVKSDTVRKWIKAEKLPPPDVKINNTTSGWRASTLMRAGFPAPSPKRPDPPQVIQPVEPPQPAVAPPARTYKERKRAFHLYRHFSEDGVLLYVGVSLSSLNRLAQHKNESHWFWSIARVEIECFATRQESLDAEKTAIQQERPLFNSHHSRWLQ